MDLIDGALNWIDLGAIGNGVLGGVLLVAILGICRSLGKFLLKRWVGWRSDFAKRLRRGVEEEFENYDPVFLVGRELGKMVVILFVAMAAMSSVDREVLDLETTAVVALTSALSWLVGLSLARLTFFKELSRKARRGPPPKRARRTPMVLRSPYGDARSPKKGREASL